MCLFFSLKDLDIFYHNLFSTSIRFIHTELLYLLICIVYSIHNSPWCFRMLMKPNICSKLLPSFDWVNIILYDTSFIFIALLMHQASRMFQIIMLRTSVQINLAQICFFYNWWLLHFKTEEYSFCHLFADLGLEVTFCASLFVIQTCVIFYHKELEEKWRPMDLSKPLSAMDYRWYLH